MLYEAYSRICIKALNQTDNHCIFLNTAKLLNLLKLTVNMYLLRIARYTLSQPGPFHSENGQLFSCMCSGFTAIMQSCFDNMENKKEIFLLA